MTSIHQLIQQEINPFDRVNLKPGNFWRSAQESSSSLVASIHQDALADITQRLEQVAQDQVSRTVLLMGDSGSGKSYLLSRLKQTLNDRAFFAYIGPWADTAYIWRHVLRYTVDSLMQIPDGQSESQLMLWLKGLSAFTKRTVKQRIFNDSVWGLLQSDRQKFIKHLKKHYKTANLYSSDIFLGLLHDLTDPALYPLACEWLRGDDLSEASLELLHLKQGIDSEDMAKSILANISKIAADTQPIVLCFDNLDNIPQDTEGHQDFQALFNFNSMIHTDQLNNFLIIISIVTDTWNRSIQRVKSADRARIERPHIRLKRIDLDQAEALWAEQLKPLHLQAKPKPPSPTFPLTRDQLETSFPGGKTIPRAVLTLGKTAYQDYKVQQVGAPVPRPVPKHKLKPGESQPPGERRAATAKPVLKPPKSSTEATSVPADGLDPTLPEAESLIQTEAATAPQPTPLASAQLQAEFKLEWGRELQKTQKKITKITLRSAPELIRMLQETLLAFGIAEVKLKLLTGKYASYSLQYQHPSSQDIIGLVWTEDASMQAFYHVMNACQKLVGDRCQRLQLLRSDPNMGKPSTSGFQIYRQLFVKTQNQHIKPKLASVQEIATYHSLVNSALAQELVLDGQTIHLSELQSLVVQTNALHRCQLLQDLEILQAMPDSEPELASKSSLQFDQSLISDYIMNLMITQSFIGRAALISAALEQFPDAQEPLIEQLLQQLYEANRLQIVNPKESLDKQTICVLF
jgi:hypothetical protein